MFELEYFTLMFWVVYKLKRIQTYLIRRFRLQYSEFTYFGVNKTNYDKNQKFQLYQTLQIFRIWQAFF